MIVGMLPTYKEGMLALDAINSLLPICDSILVFEGPISGAPVHGLETDFKSISKIPKVVVKHGEWKSEIHKRNSMLDFTRRYKSPIWGVFLDADEVFLWSQYIPSYIEACNAQAPDNQENVSAPILRVEIDGSVQTLTRIVRLDLLERHVLSMSQWKFIGQEAIATLPAIPSERAPNQGEPHIFHRAFLRPKARGDFRLYEREIKDFETLEKAERERLGLTNLPSGAIPIQKDGVFVPIGQQGLPDDPYGILRR